jgi:hypothetical protein
MQQVSQERVIEVIHEILNGNPDSFEELNPDQYCPNQPKLKVNCVNGFLLSL